MNEEQKLKLGNLFAKSELDADSLSLMTRFFESISGQPQFNKILDLLERFPSLFENFCKCFMLKREFLGQGKTEAEWYNFLQSEKDVFSQLE